MAPSNTPSNKPKLTEVHFIAMVHIYDCAAIRGETKEIKLRDLTGSPIPTIKDDSSARMVTVTVETRSDAIVHHRIPYENICRLVYEEQA